MRDHHLVYQQDGSFYQDLIDKEDFQGNLLPALEKIISLDGLDVVDLGAGTGRLTGLLAPRVKSIHAYDLSPHMLEVAAVQLRNKGFQNWAAAAADHRWIPQKSRTADLIISGWSFCYLVVWHEVSWRKDLSKGLQEMTRLLRPGGALIIIETLGTGTTEPIVAENLAGYYKYLETSGFRHSWIRTDYQFESREEAASLVDFFFGHEMLSKISPGNKPVLPECTGIWSMISE
jgi:ubiquinone/menaquinone biosynthesis C-methylase UbiE